MLGHGVLLYLWSPLPDSSLAGQEHGRTIPLAEITNRTANSCLPPSRAIETIGNHQQERRRRETGGNRHDPVDETSDDLRTPGLKRYITLARHFGGCHHRDWPFEQSRALHISDLGKFAARCARA